MPWGTKSRHERGYGSAWIKLREHIMRRDTYLCQPCKANNKLTQAREVDHITPKAKGGTDDPDNLQAICIPCHKAKTEAEALEGQGRTGKRTRYDEAGWPVWPEG